MSFDEGRRGVALSLSDLVFYVFFDFGEKVANFLDGRYIASHPPVILGEACTALAHLQTLTMVVNTLVYSLLSLSRKNRTIQHNILS